MPDDFVINVRQIAQYQFVDFALFDDLLLLQRGGLGGPYISITAGDLVKSALWQDGPLGVGVVPPTNSEIAQIFTRDLSLALDEGILWNAYATGPSATSYLTAGTAGILAMSTNGHFVFESAPAGAAGQPNWNLWVPVFEITPGGYLICHDQMTVARDPGVPMEVMTFGLASNWRQHSVVSFNGRFGDIVLTEADVMDAGAAPIDSPDFVGIPTVPDIPDPFASTEQIANTRFVQAAISYNLLSYFQSNPFVTTFNGRHGAVRLTADDIEDAGGAPLRSPHFSGTPTAPMPAEFDMSGQLATTAWVQQRTDLIRDWANCMFASRCSPHFSGEPTAPSPPTSDRSNRIATTEWVMWQVDPLVNQIMWLDWRIGQIETEGGGWASKDWVEDRFAPIWSPQFQGEPRAPSPPQFDVSTRLATTEWVTWNFQPVQAQINYITQQVNNVNADLTGYAKLDSPHFTGIPTTPMPDPGAPPNQIPTLQWVIDQLTAATAGVVSFNTRTGAVTLTTADVTGAGGAPLASPAFSGAPTAPNPPGAANSGEIATAGWVRALIAAGALPSQPNNTVLGNISGAAATPAPINAAQLRTLIGTFTGPTAGLVPVAGTGFLHSDGTWADPIAAAGGPFLPTAGGTVTGNVYMTNGGQVQTIGPSNASHVTASGQLVTDGGGNPQWQWSGDGTSWTLMRYVGVTEPAITVPANTGIVRLAHDPVQPLDAATKGYVDAAAAAGGVASFNGRTGAVTLATSDVVNAGGAVLASPAFTGGPTAPTQAPGTNNTMLATTAFVAAAVLAGTAAYAPLASPVFSGVATVPTPSVGSSSLQIANTAWVTSAVAAALNQVGANYLPLTGGTLTGALNVNMAGPYISLQATTGNATLNLFGGTGGGIPVITGFRSGQPRWSIYLGDNTAESGSNNGSNFELQRFTDAGAPIDAPLYVRRSDGAIITSGIIQVAPPSTNDAAVYISKPGSGHTSYLIGTSGGQFRWQMQIGNNSAESGGNLGSDFALLRFSDSGTYLDTPFSIMRATGVSTFTDVTVASTNPQLVLNNSASGSQILGESNGSPRWVMNLGNIGTEAAGNVGSDFSLVRYGNNGVAIDSPFVINRATGAVTFTGGISADSLKFTRTPDISGTDLNLLTSGGFYCGSSFANGPPSGANTSSWSYYIEVLRYFGNANYVMQRATSLSWPSGTEQAWWRVMVGGGWDAWHQVISTGINGAGAADTMIPAALGVQGMLYAYGGITMMSNSAINASGSAVSAGDLTVNRGATSGVVFFGTDHNHYLIFDGTEWTFNSGPVFMQGAVIGPTVAQSIVTAINVGYQGGAMQYGSSYRPAADNATPCAFFNAAGTQVGAIQTAAGNTAYQTTSDARLKHEAREFEAGAIIDRLSPVEHGWKDHPNAPRIHGLMAQDAHGVYPEAVYQPQRDDQPWMIDYSKFVPLLLAEIKALRARVAALEGA